MAKFQSTWRAFSKQSTTCRATSWKMQWWLRLSTFGTAGWAAPLQLEGSVSAECLFFITALLVLKQRRGVHSKKIQITQFKVKETSKNCRIFVILFYDVITLEALIKAILRDLFTSYGIDHMSNSYSCRWLKVCVHPQTHHFRIASTTSGKPPVGPVKPFIPQKQK